MKKKNIFLLAALAGLLLAGCNKTSNVNDVDSTLQKGSCPAGPLSQLTVRVGTPSTKTGVTVQEETISNLQVLVYGPDGKLEAYGSKGAAELSLSCTAGSKIIYAFVNTPSLETVYNMADLSHIPFSLTNVSEGRLPMKGRVQTTLSGSNDLTIEVERMVCKIVLKTISVTSSESYPAACLKIDKIYLANAVSAGYLDGTISQWSNKLGQMDACSPLLYDLYEPTPLQVGDSKTVNNVYYAMPNPTETDSFSGTWCPRYTRLVLSGQFCDGKTMIREGYYPIPLAGLKANNCYVIDSYTITRPGLEHPYDDGTKLTEGISIRVADWEENTAIIESL